MCCAGPTKLQRALRCSAGARSTARLVSYPASCMSATRPATLIPKPKTGWWRLQGDNRNSLITSRLNEKKRLTSFKRSNAHLFIATTEVFTWATAPKHLIVYSNRPKKLSGTVGATGLAALLGGTSVIRQHDLYAAVELAAGGCVIPRHGVSLAISPHADAVCGNAHLHQGVTHSIRAAG